MEGGCFMKKIKLNNIGANFIYADSKAGDMVLSNTNINGSFNMLNDLINKPKYLFNNILNVLKDHKKRMIVIILSLIWFLSVIFKSFGIDFFLINWINYLSFANGGTHGNIIAIIGGFIGKTIFAYFVAILLLSEKGKINWIKSGINNFIKALDFKNKKQYPMMGIGIGISLIIYNFIAGNASINNSMMGIIALLLLIRSFSNNNIYIRKILGLVTNKLKNIIPSVDKNISPIIVGCVFGFVLGIIISFVMMNNLCYIIGLAILFIAVILSIIFKKTSN